MGMFRSHPAPAPESLEDDLDHQNMALEVSGAFEAHDAARLRTLTEAELKEQLRARQALYDYVTALWEDAKARGLDPATLPEWSVVAGMRDLTMGLVTQALGQATAEGE